MSGPRKRYLMPPSATSLSTPATATLGSLLAGLRPRSRLGRALSLLFLPILRDYKASKWSSVRREKIAYHTIGQQEYGESNYVNDIVRNFSIKITVFGGGSERPKKGKFVKAVFSMLSQGHCTLHALGAAVDSFVSLCGFPLRA